MSRLHHRAPSLLPLLVVLLTALLGGLARAEPPAMKEQKHHPRLEVTSKDGRYSVAVGGFLQARYAAAFTADALESSRFGVPRTRIYVFGRLFSRDIRYRLMLGTAPYKTDVELFDAYVEWWARPWARVVSGSQVLRARFPGTPVAIGERIREVQDVFKGLYALGDDFAPDGRQFDRLLADGEAVTAGSLKLDVIATPGHTPACVSYHIEDAVFTGDALFMPDYGTGRCDFPRGSAEALYRSVTDRLYRLPDDTRVFVGHDYQPGGRPLAYESTIAAEKRGNVQLPEGRSESEFVTFRTARDAGLAAPKLLHPSLQVNIRAGHLPTVANDKTSRLAHPIEGLAVPRRDVATSCNVAAAHGSREQEYREDGAARTLQPDSSMSTPDQMMHQLRVDLDGALLASAIWRDPEAPLVSFMPPPDAIQRFDRFTTELRDLLKGTGFPSLGGYYLLALEQDRMVVVLVSGDVRWGMLVDTRRATLGMLLSVALPAAQVELNHLTATNVREDDLP